MQPIPPYLDITLHFSYLSAAYKQVMYNMKSLTIIVLSGIIFLCSCSQNFEGVITYETTYISKVDGVSADEMFGQNNSKDTTFLKDGFYLHKANTNRMPYLLWRGVDTLHYYKETKDSDTIWTDKTNSHPVFIDSTRVEKDVDNIAGYLCDKLIVYRNNRVYEYYYNPDFKIEPKYYKEYTNSARYEVVKLMKSPTLRLKVSSPSSVMDMVATNVEIKSLPDSLFKVPDGFIMKD